MRVPLNALIEVGREGQAGADECQVESADDSALTCIVERPEGEVRLVFPRGTVEKVRVMERAKERHIGRWIAVGVGVGLVVAAGVSSGVLGFAVVGLMVLGVGRGLFLVFLAESAATDALEADLFGAITDRVRTDAVFCFEKLLEVLGEGSG